MQVPRYHDEPMWWVLKTLGEMLALKEPGQHIRFQVVNPDLGVSLYPGELWSEDGVSLRYRSLADWIEVAEVLGCRMHTPRTLEHPWVEMTFTRLDHHRSWHQDSLPSGNPEKYGSQTEYGRIQKFERPHDVSAFVESLEFVRLPQGGTVLSLGVNRGDELQFIWEHTRHLRPPRRLLGLDHSSSAIRTAQARFGDGPFEFRVADLSHFETLGLGSFDLVVAINTLHSPQLDGQSILRRIVKSHLTPGGALLLGFPNCRYIDHTVRYGAQTKNYRSPEYSVLFKAVGAYKRYLHQQGFTVTITGRHTLFLTARRPMGTSEE